MIENLHPGATAANARVALFDFDGTISVIRSGWMEIMIPMMVEILMDLKTGEREDDLRAIVEEFVGRLTGKQTMYQMIAMAEEIEKREEARLLDVDRYFDGGVYGALDNYKSFSKKILIQRLIASSEYRGNQFLGFGDGYVEIENVKEVGGVAVGVATAEPECLHVDEWKRKRLSGVGADFIIPNYLCRDELLGTLFPA